jgi:hypothetical protein
MVAMNSNGGKHQNDAPRATSPEAVRMPTAPLQPPPEPTPERPPVPDLLVHQERDLIILNALSAKADKGMPEDEIIVLVQWALETRLRSKLLDLALAGELTLDVVQMDDKKDVTFRRPSETERQAFQAQRDRLPT